MAKRILILGAGGFIGSNLLEYFLNRFNDGDDRYELYAHYHAKDCDVDSSSTPNLSGVCKGDLTNPVHVDGIFNWARPHIVIHCAAVTTGAKDTLERPWLHVTDNIRMNALVMETCHTHGVEHCVWFSCTVMYQPKDVPQKESDWQDGVELYPTYFGVGNMKVYTEKLCQFYSRQGKCKYTAIRHSNVYGPNDKFDLDKCHMLPAMVKKICDLPDVEFDSFGVMEHGQVKPELEVWGTGQARRDLIYVDDLVDFVSKVIEKQTTPYELFNCGAGYAFSINDILGMLQYVTQKSFNIKYNSTKPDIPTTVMLDCTKAKEILGWKYKTSLHDGLYKTVKYYESIK